MAKVLVTKPGVLSAADRKMLRDNGVVVVQADNPADVRLLDVEGPNISSSDLFWAAMQGVCGLHPKQDFAEAVKSIAKRGGYGFAPAAINQEI